MHSVLPRFPKCILLFIYFECLFNDFEERKEERGGNVDLLFYSFMYIYWLIPICALTGDGTSNLGVSGQRSDQLSYPAGPDEFYYRTLLSSV